MHKGLVVVVSSEEVFMIKLPSKSLVEATEKELGEGASYPLPKFYDDFYTRFGTPLNIPDKASKLDFHAGRIGDYSIRMREAEGLPGIVVDLFDRSAGAAKIVAQALGVRGKHYWKSVEDPSRHEAPRRHLRAEPALLRHRKICQPQTWLPLCGAMHGARLPSKHRHFGLKILPARPRRRSLRSRDMYRTMA